MQDVEYNLSLTDPIWRETLAQLPDGEYSAQDAIAELNLDNFHPDRFLLTISLVQAFRVCWDAFPPKNEPSNDCTKRCKAFSRVLMKVSQPI